MQSYVCDEIMTELGVKKGCAQGKEHKESGRDQMTKKDDDKSLGRDETNHSRVRKKNKKSQRNKRDMEDQIPTKSGCGKGRGAGVHRERDSVAEQLCARDDVRGVVEANTMCR